MDPPGRSRSAMVYQRQDTNALSEKARQSWVDAELVGDGVDSDATHDD